MTQKVIPSAAPGTGPRQTRTTDTQPPKPFIPGPPNGLGYGGGGDSLPVLPMPVDRDKPPVGLGQVLSVAGPPKPIVPRFNTLYDTLRTRSSAWRYLSDDVITVTFTPSAGSTVETAITSSINSPGQMNRVMQFPGGLQMYLVIRTLSVCPQVTTGTGVLELRFKDTAEQIVPLGCYLANAGSGLVTTTALVPTPITNPGQTNYGVLQAISQGLGGTLGTTVAQLGISYAYLLPTPAFKGWHADE